MNTVMHKISHFLVEQQKTEQPWVWTITILKDSNLTGTSDCKIDLKEEESKHLRTTSAELCTKVSKVQPYLSSSSWSRLLTVWALFSRVNLCRRKKVCWNIRNRYSSKSIGTQFFDTSSLTHVMASTPSRARSTLVTSFCCPFLPPPFDGVFGWSCPLEDDELQEIKDPVLVFVLRSQPNRAKWKIEANNVGVMLVDRGIQLKRWAKHSNTRQHSWWLSLSSAAMGWHSSFEYWLPWNKFPSNSTRRRIEETYE